MKLTIRPLEPGDTRALLAYVNDLIAEDTYLTLSGKKMTYAEEQKYVKDSIARIKKNEKIHMIALSGDRVVGSADLRRGEKRKVHTGEIGIAILPSHRGKGLGSRLLQAVLDGAKHLGLRMVILHCFENNTVALSLYKKFGFIRCCTLPEAVHWHGMYVGDVTLYKNLR